MNESQEQEINKVTSTTLVLNDNRVTKTQARDDVCKMDIKW